MILLVDKMVEAVCYYFPLAGVYLVGQQHILLAPKNTTFNQFKFIIDCVSIISQGL